MKKCQECGKCSITQQKTCVDMYYENSNRVFPCGQERMPYVRERIFEAMKRNGYEVYDKQELARCLQCVLEGALRYVEWADNARSLLVGAVGMVTLLNGGEDVSCAKRIANGGRPCLERVLLMQRVATEFAERNAKAMLAAADRAERKQLCRSITRWQKG